MFLFSKEDSVTAAKQFCFAMEVWTDSFVGPKSGFTRFEQNMDGIYLVDKKTDNYLSKARFVCNIDAIYDFADTGSWNGINIFESRDYLANELVDILTELSSFSEITKYQELNFHDESGDGVMDIDINGKRVIDILSEVIRMAFARFSLIDGTITLDELALLANVSTKTVKNSVSAKGPNRIVLDDSSTDGKPCVGHMEAMRWLVNKKGFAGPFFMDEIPEYLRYESLGQLQYHCIALLKHASLSIDDIKKEYSWDDSILKAFRKLLKITVDNNLSLITPSSLKEFGERCNAKNLELFVREASKVIAITYAEYQSKKLFQ